MNSIQRCGVSRFSIQFCFRWISLATATRMRVLEITPSSGEIMKLPHVAGQMTGSSVTTIAVVLILE